MTHSIEENIFEKHTWILFVLIGFMIIVGGIPHILGFNTDPASIEAISGETIEALKASSPDHFNLYDFYFRSGGLSDLGVAFFIIIIATFGYRKGEKWAWYALWFVPVFFLLFVFISIPLPQAARISMIPPLLFFTTISLLGLLLPIRKFFPR